MKKKTPFFSYLGVLGGGGLMWNPGENCMAVRPHHRADICITREKINHQLL